MTKDWLLVGPTRLVTTMGFLEEGDENLKQSRSAAISRPLQTKGS